MLSCTICTLVRNPSGQQKTGGEQPPSTPLRVGWQYCRLLSATLSMARAGWQACGMAGSRDTRVAQAPRRRAPRACRGPPSLLMVALVYALRSCGTLATPERVHIRCHAASLIHSRSAKLNLPSS